ncbi:hemolysin family protein [soil metagenome]
MTDELLKLAAVAFLILLNGFFVAAEFSLVSARSAQIDELAAKGSWSALAVQKAMAQPNRFISACQVGITMASITLGWIAEPAIAHLIEPSLERLLGENAWVGAHIVSAAIAILLITTLHIVLGEQVPKMIAIQRSERAILTTAPVIGWLALPIRPFIAMLYWLTDLSLDTIRLTRQAEHSLVYTEDELKMLVSASRMQGYLEASEQEMIERVFEFADVETDEIMVPRTEMLALSTSSTLDNIAELVASSGHTRFPVYGDHLDNLIGVFHAKDLILQQFESGVEGFNILLFVRPAVFVSAHTPLDELLATMKLKRSHMAIVVDEYGGTAGLVTLEDVLERIVGDVHDQDDGPAEVEHLGGGIVRVSGLLSIVEVNEQFGTSIEDEYYNSLGGFVFGQLGRKPELGDEVRANGHLFRVAELDGVRIDRIEIFKASAEGQTSSGQMDDANAEAPDSIFDPV